MSGSLHEPSFLNNGHTLSIENTALCIKDEGRDGLSCP
ncbi:hypothetical protein NeNHUV3_25070 (plasmid) [Nereida sp. NH-UV-3]